VPLDRLQQEREMVRQLREQWKVPETALGAAAHWQMEIAQFGIHAALLDVLRRLRALSPDAVQRLKQTDFGAGLRRVPAIPGYRLTGRIASGPRTALFAAQPQFTPGPAGLKLLHPDLSRDAAQVARFKQDATLLRRFDHPCLLKGIEYATLPVDADGTALHYFTTEFVRGTTLDQLVTIKGKLPPARAVAIALDVAQAMRHLEKEGYSHGELVPHNVIVDDRLRGRLIDAGCAQQFRPGSAPDPRVPEDVHALGQLLRMMLSGTTSTDRSGETGSASLPSALLGVIRSMLHPDPTRRFQRFADLVAVLQATTNV
jgi:serine/threonine protein kinase